MPASLLARDITLSLGTRIILDDVDIVVDPGHRIGLVGPNGVGKTHAAARPRRRAARPSAARCARARATPTSATCPGARAHRRDGAPSTSPGAPASASATAELRRGDRRRSPPAPTGADDRYADALERWLALGAADFEARLGRRVGRSRARRVAARPADAQPVRRRGGPGRARRAAAGPLRRVPARRADQRPRPRRAGPPGAVRHRPRRAAWSSSATTARSSSAPSPTSSSSTSSPTRPRCYAGGWSAYLAERAAARARAVEAYEEYDTKRSTLVSPRPARAGVGVAGPVAGQEASRTTTTRTSATGRSTRPSSSPARRRAPSGRWSGWTSSSSRASRGSCG